MFAYEYEGYGPSKNAPNDFDILKNILAAYTFL